MVQAITLTHMHTGEKVHVMMDKITYMREKGGYTLVVCGAQGFYVEETAEVIFTLMRMEVNRNA